MDLLELVWDLVRLPFLYAYDVARESWLSLEGRMVRSCLKALPLWHPGCWPCAAAVTVRKASLWWWSYRSKWGQAPPDLERPAPCGCGEE